MNKQTYSRYFFQTIYGKQPPLLVQRCNGTTAGQGYLEVGGIPMQNAPSGNEPVTALSCCRIWTVWMIIVPNLRWRIFRYWAVRASDVRDIGSSPEGEHWVIPLLTLTWKSQVTTLQTNCKPATIQLSDASSPHHQCNHNVMYLLMSASCTKKQ